MEHKKRSKGRGWESCYVNKIYGTFGVEMRAYGQKLVKLCTHTHTHTRVSYSSIDNLPLTVLLHATCYTPFHGARERVTSGGAVWLVVRVVFVVAINTCNTLQWRRVRDTNSCRRLITCSSGIRDK